jgi:hypothetical protein
MAQKNPWHAVSIVARANACAAALQWRGIRFLSREAPRLPLSTCSCGPDCGCVYRHHDDRREGPRRADESSGIRRGIPPLKEQRTGRGRRAAD